jgi:hypothetical protein
MTSKYNVTITLTRPMLGTNPLNPHVLDTHVLDRQRKMIAQDGGKTNRAINKYLDAVQISDERRDQEMEAIIGKLESMTGRKYEESERQKLIAGTLEDLKETFAELDMKGTTVFFRDPATGRPMIGDHMIYGFLKAAAEAIGRTLEKKNSTPLHSISYTESLINQHIRCEDRFIVFDRDLVQTEDGKTAYLQRSLRAETAQGPRISLAKSEMVPEGAVLNFTFKVMEGSPLTEKILRRLFDYGDFVGLGQWRNSGYGMFTYALEEL